MHSSRRLGHKPTLAESLLVRGRLKATLGKLEDAERDLNEALLAAEASGHQSLRIEIWLSLASTVGVKAAQVAEGSRLAKQALAIAEGQGGNIRWTAEALLVQAQVHQIKGEYDSAEALLQKARSMVEESGLALPLLRVSLANARGKLSLLRGRLDEAEQHYKEALASISQLLGDSHPLIATVYTNLGSVAKDRGRSAEGLEHYERARALFAQVLGPEHVEVGRVLGNIGLIHMEVGPREEALEEHQESLRILQEQLGDAHPSVGLQLNNVGLTLIYLKREQEAVPYLERSKTLFAAIDPNHERIAMADSNLGLAYLGLRDLDRSRKHYGEAVDRFEKNHGTIHPEVARCLSRLALIEILGEDYQAAAPLLARAIAAFEKTTGPVTASVAANALDLGWVQTQLGNQVEAKKQLERAVAIFDQIEDPDPYRHGSARFELAKLLWAESRQGARARARELAQQAATAYELGGERRADDVAEVRVWLRSHSR